MWRLTDKRQLGGLALALVCVLLVLAPFIPMPASQSNEVTSTKDEGRSSVTSPEMMLSQSENLATPTANAASAILRDDPFARAIQRARADAANAGPSSGEIQGKDLLTAVAESKKRMAPISTASPFGGGDR